MWDRWFGTNLNDAAAVLLSTLCVYGIIILYTRLAGLRSFSKMSASDFAMTVAVGSLLGGSIVQPSPTVLLAAVALASIFFFQWLIAYLRTQAGTFSAVIDNSPVLLMSGPNILEQNMRSVHVTNDDLHAKLREANVWNYEQVLAVIFEATGDISVIHADDSNTPPIEQAIFASVVGGEQLMSTAGGKQ